MSPDEEIPQAVEPDDERPLAKAEPAKEVPQAVEPDDERPIAEAEPAKEAPQAVEPAQEDPLTREAFAAQMRLLTERARAAGLNPLRVLAQTYTKQGMVILEGLLGSLESADSSRTTKKKE